MILMRILPGVLKELLKHVPTVLFQAVEWSVLASELPKLSRRLIQKEGHDTLLENQQRILDQFGIELTDHVISIKEGKVNKAEAEKILILYFAQLYSPHGLFLDLRSEHFNFYPPDKLLWGPSGLWTKFHPDFQKGLLEVYDGFYLGDEELYNQGLEGIGLVSPDWPQEDKDRLREIFKSHFGSSISKEMVFNLEDFKNSLLRITDFVLQKKVKISTDFMYLGIYLITLYSSLEKCSEGIEVKDIYMKVRSALA